VDVPARGKKPAIKVYALDAGELDAIIENAPRTACRARNARSAASRAWAR
jgi:hypothetical protein